MSQPYWLSCLDVNERMDAGLVESGVPYVARTKHRKRKYVSSKLWYSSCRLSSNAFQVSFHSHPRRAYQVPYNRLSTDYSHYTSLSHEGLRLGLSGSYLRD
jgi:hypothetical protein